MAATVVSMNVERTAPTPTRRLSVEQARVERAAHEERADALTAGHRERRQAGRKHPVEDFLFTYYPFSAARLRRWHPGADTAYDAAADLGPDGRGIGGDVAEDGSRSWYVDESGDEHDETGPENAAPPAAPRRWRRADVARYLGERADALAFMTTLLRRSSSATRTPNFGCFGLHEWAMVYKLQPGQQRHESLPLRLGQEETDAVVERERLVCTHIDAFRFFTPPAAPRNAHQPTRSTQQALDNPACLHVGMDLYKWAMKLTPLVPSDLVLDCFEHARDLRILDMEASPYDVRPLGYGVVPIETPVGKAEYARRQRSLAERSEALRQRILAAVAPLSADAVGPDDDRLDAEEPRWPVSISPPHALCSGSC